jgi:hypothetical protein
MDGHSHTASLELFYDGAIPSAAWQAASAADAAEAAARPAVPPPLPCPAAVARAAREKAARIAAFEALPPDQHGFRKWGGRYYRYADFVREAGR